MEYNFKICIDGVKGVGKTSLFRTFFYQDFERNPSYFDLPLDKAIKNTSIDGNGCKIQIWDIGSGKTIEKAIHSFYHGSAGALMVFDVSSRKSLNELSKKIFNFWEVTRPESRDQTKPIVLVGNKCDLRDSLSTKQVITFQTGKEFAEKMNFRAQSSKNCVSYIETSVKDQINVESAFFTLFRNILPNL